MSSNIKENLRDSYEEFLEERKSGIGGSDASAICRKNKWRNPVDVYLEKIGEGKPIKDNARMELGRDMEDKNLDAYQRITGNRLMVNDAWIAQQKRIITDPEYALKLIMNPNLSAPKYERFYVHGKYDFLIGHLDGVCADHPILVESKVVTFFYEKEWGDTVQEGYDSMGSIPIAYYYQIQHYMCVSNLEEAHLIVNFCGMMTERRIYKFKRDHGHIARTRASLISFWRDNVLKKNAPRALTKEEVSKLYPAPKTDEMKEAGVEDEMVVKELKKINADLKELQIKKKKAMDELATHIGEGLGLKITDQDGTVRKLATFNANKRGSRTFRAYG